MGIHDPSNVSRSRNYCDRNLFRTQFLSFNSHCQDPLQFFPSLQIRTLERTTAGPCNLHGLSLRWTHRCAVLHAERRLGRLRVGGCFPLAFRLLAFHSRGLNFHAVVCFSV